MRRFSKILNREISENEVFQIDNYTITRSYTDLSPNDMTINHTLRIRFKFDFSDLDAVGNVVYMEELANDHFNRKPAGVMEEDRYFFKTVGSVILKRLV